MVISGLLDTEMLLVVFETHQGHHSRFFHLRTGPIHFESLVLALVQVQGTLRLLILLTLIRHQ
jgi:hypothetical protein